MGFEPLRARLRARQTNARGAKRAPEAAWRRGWNGVRPVSARRRSGWCPAQPWCRWNGTDGDAFHGAVLSCHGPPCGEAIARAESPSAMGAEPTPYSPLLTWWPDHGDPPRLPVSTDRGPVEEGQHLRSAVTSEVERAAEEV